MLLKPNKIKVFCFFCIAFFLFLKTFVFDIKYVSGNSMEPTLKNGDCIIILKAAYGIKLPFKNIYILRWAEPKQGDIILYRNNGHFAVKRCYGISGQAIEFYKKLGYNGSYDYSMYICKKEVPLTAIQFRNLGGMTDKKDWLVPKGTVLALGDNPKESYDSRDYGFVLIDGIYGKVFYGSR